MKTLSSVFILFLIAGCSTNKSVKEIPPPVNDIEIDKAHNSQNSLDWDGVYRGVLPCADCEGIKTELVLKRDLTYAKTIKYLGESDSIITEKGTFSWNELGNAILLNEELSTQYQVGENILFKLDNEGKRISGNLALNYQLKKVTPTIYDRKWSLINFPDVQRGLLEKTHPYFILNLDNQRIAGNGGCNSFGGSYNIVTRDSISFGPLAATKRACLVEDIEYEFFQFLDKTNSYSLQKDTLTLRSTEGEKAVFLDKFFD